MTSQAFLAVHHLAREKDGKRRLLKENVHERICSIMEDPVRARENLCA